MPFFLKRLTVGVTRLCRRGSEDPIVPLSAMCRVFDAWDGGVDAPPHDLYEPLEVASHVDRESSLIAWRESTEPLLAFDQKLLEVAIRVMADDYARRTPGAPTLDAKGADALAAAILLRYGVGPDLDSSHLEDREVAALRCLLDLTADGAAVGDDHDLLATVYFWPRPFSSVFDAARAQVWNTFHGFGDAKQRRKKKSRRKSKRRSDDEDDSTEGESSSAPLRRRRSRSKKAAELDAIDGNGHFTGSWVPNPYPQTCGIGV